ncbi:MAG: serine hydrolase [Bacteroidetes bacterium]|nr:MAG: serine hydrolase [Bacteroidota bacterium]
MRKSFIVFIILIVLFQISCMIKKTPLAGLEFEIEKKLFIDSAQFGVAFKNVQTGETLLMNEKESFHAASTMKTPVLIELFKQASTGKFSMSDSIEIKNNFKSIVDGSEYSLDSADDSEFELYKVIGQKRTIADLAYNMIILSSNMATNMLIELVTADSVMKTMKSLGAKDIQVLRGVEDSKAFEKGLNNTTTAYDQMLLYNLLAKEKLVNKEASNEMTRILLDQKFNTVIPAKLPPEVKVAHKTGSITGVQHDAGVVILPDGRKYVLVLLSRFKKEDEKKVIEAMAAVSKLVYDYVMKH